MNRFLLLSGILLAFLFSGCSKSFVPKEYIPPQELVNNHFILKPIKATDAKEDYTAVMESREIIHQSLLSDAWPRPDFTVEEDFADLKKKEKEFTAKTAFTYSIFTHDMKRIIGSVYINKGHNGADAAVFFWVRSSEFDQGYDMIIEKELRKWMKTEWPFDVVVFPGRDDKLTAFFNSIYPENTPGAVVHIEMDKNNRYNAAFGLAKVDGNKKLSKNMIFPIGSMTKAYTATAIMQLVEAQKLSLEDDLLKFFPDFSTDFKKVTIKHLLGNTSGIVSYNRIPEYQKKSMKSDLTLTQMIDFFKDKPLKFEPGSRFRYSNSNYILLSVIIEKVSHESYNEFIKSKIINPLGITETYFSEKEAGENVPTGYTHSSGSWQQNGENTSHTFGAGMMFSSSSDLAKFISSLNRHEIISKKSLDFLYSVQIEHKDGRPDEYAHGFWVTNVEGEKTIKMEGYCAGFYTSAFYFTDKEVAVIVLPNSDIPHESANPAFVARWVHRLISNKPVSAYWPIILPDSQLRKFQGVYRIDDQNVRQVFVKENKMYTLRTAGQMLEAKPYFENRFFYPNTFTEFKFVKTADGSILMIMTDDSGQQTMAPKTEKSIRKPIKVNKNILKKHVGKYEKRFEIFMDGEKLMFTNGFHRYQLFPKSKTEFYPWHEDAVFCFEKKNGSSWLTYSIGDFSMKVKKVK